jgi:predicted DNA-binding transcriptional regulator AlpA
MLGTNRWLTIGSFAKYLKLSCSNLYRMAQDQDVPASVIAF